MTSDQSVCMLHYLEALCRCQLWLELAVTDKNACLEGVGILKPGPVTWFTVSLTNHIRRYTSSMWQTEVSVRGRTAVLTGDRTRQDKHRVIFIDRQGAVLVHMLAHHQDQGPSVKWLHIDSPFKRLAHWLYQITRATAPLSLYTTPNPVLNNMTR